MKKIATLVAGALLALSLSNISSAEVGYISDIFYVPVRSGAGNQYRIVHQGLRTGTQLEVHQTEGDWTQITTDGVDGWVPSQYVSQQPPARIQLAQTEQRLSRVQQENKDLSAQLNEIQQRNAELRNQVQQYEETATEATSELAEVRALSADAINLNQRHRELLEQYQMLQTEIDALRAENDRLESDTTINKWLYGAGLVVFGIFLSIILPALKPKKRFSDWA